MDIHIILMIKNKETKTDTNTETAN
jgi:hypothetical protein